MRFSPGCSCCVVKACIDCGMTGGVEGIAPFSWKFKLSALGDGTSCTGGGPSCNAVIGERLGFSNKLNTISASGFVACEWFSDQDICGTFHNVRTVLYGRRNEIQRIRLFSSPVTSGTFTLTFQGQTTAAIVWNATAVEVHEALLELSNVEVGDVITSDGPLPNTGIFVEFDGQHASTNVDLLTVDNSSLGGGGAYEVIETQRGYRPGTLLVGEATYELDGTWRCCSAGTYNLVNAGTLCTGFPSTLIVHPVPQNHVQQVYVTGTGGTFTLIFKGQTTTPIAYNATSAQIKAALEALSSFGVDDHVDVLGSSFPRDVYFVGVDEVQTITFTGSPTGGTFRLKMLDSFYFFEDKETVDIPYSTTGTTTATSIQNAFNSFFQAGLVTVTSISSTVYTIKFNSSWGSRDLDLLIVTNNSLTGGSSPSLGITETTKGKIGLARKTQPLMTTDGSLLTDGASSVVHYTDGCCDDCAD